MAIQLVKCGFPFPAWPFNLAAGPNTANTTLAVNQKAAVVYRSTTSKDIRKVRFRTVTTSTGGTLDVRIETVDVTTGFPTGTLFGTNTNVAHVLGSGDDNVWLVTAALTADANLAVGDLYAIVIVADATAATQIPQYADCITSGFPYGLTSTAGTYAINTGNLLIVPEYSDASLEPVFGFTDVGSPINTTTYNSGTATNRRGNIFSLPFPARASGCWGWIDTDGDYSMQLYDSAGTGVLATTGTIDKDVRGSANPGIQHLPFLAPVELAANTNYRIAIVPETVTDLTSYGFDVPVATMLDMFPGGQACHRSLFTSSAWVETTTSRGFIGIYLDGFDDGVGGSGGGMRMAGRGGLATSS